MTPITQPLKNAALTRWRFQALPQIKSHSDAIDCALQCYQGVMAQQQTMLPQFRSHSDAIDCPLQCYQGVIAQQLTMLPHLQQTMHTCICCHVLQLMVHGGR